MVKIRLMRVGKSKQPSYRVVVADSRSPRDGRIIESIGHYQPRHDPSQIVIDSSRAVYWLGKGAQPSNTVKNLMRISGAWAEFTGETPSAPPTQEEVRRRATAAASVSADEAPAGEAPAEVPESADRADTAPEADSGDSDPGEGKK
ncbi:MAG: 30S ribosomal protein S16 [Actinobacteria bacterium]|nr:30S ribosomal protein S16 [Actinomycetota bacterium]